MPAEEGETSLTPDPPRFQWLARFLKFGAMVIALFFAARAIDDWYIERQTYAIIDQIRARGEPFWWEDFDADRHVSEARNGSQVIADGFRLVDRAALSWSNPSFSYRNPPVLSAAWIKLAEASESKNARAFGVWGQVIGRDQWELKYVGIDYPTETAARALADSAIYLQYVGDDAAAMDRLVTIFHISRLAMLRREERDFFVALRVADIGYAALYRIAPDLAIDRQVAPSGRKVTHPAQRAAVIALAAALRDDQPLRSGLKRVLELKRSQEFYVPHSVWLTRPIALRRRLHTLQRNDAICRTDSDLSNVEERRRANAFLQFAGSPWIVSTLPQRSDWMYKVEAEHRAAALVLAMACYRSEHPDDPWPASLDVLVPTYLSDVPTDPFRPGEPMGFTREHRSMDGIIRPSIFFGSRKAVEMAPNPRYLRAGSIETFDVDPTLALQFRNLSP